MLIEERTSAPDACAPSSDERVLDADPGDRLAVLEILAQEANSTQPRSRDDDQDVPERQLAALFELGRFEDVSRIDAMDRPGARRWARDRFSTDL